MTNAKNTKRALVSSLLALVLCMSMLIGSTYAWFTDTATTGVNTIQSGTLDIDIVDKDGKSLAGESLEFVKADAAGTEAILWEPGCTYYLEGFKIVNKGNLDAKCKIVINGLDGDSILLEAIDFYLSTDTTFDEDTDTKLSSTSTTLANDIAVMAGESTSNLYYIIGHMKEEAGNQYQNKKLEGVSVTVYATQLASEYDSYDNQYDKDATYSEIPTADVTYKDGGVNGIVVQRYVSGSGDLVQTNDMTMDGIYTFKATDSMKSVEASEYKDWLCDYYISFDKNVAADAGSIAGSYQGWNNGAWLEMPVPDGGIQAGQEIALLNALAERDLGTETTWTYSAICTLVSEFKCGVVKGWQESLNGTTMTVELRLTNPDSNETVVIDSIQYTFE